LAKEKERNHRDLTKGDHENLRVFEKSIDTRQNRAGKIREFNSIHALKTKNRDQDDTRKVGMLEDGTRKKLNIFDQSD
jgi:hypothetical protein